LHIRRIELKDFGLTVINPDQHVVVVSHLRNLKTSRCPCAVYGCCGPQAYQFADQWTTGRLTAAAAALPPLGKLLAVPSPYDVLCKVKQMDRWQ
jgi:hypothetical protein